MAGMLLAAFSAAGWAYQPLITDDTGTQGRGENQLELSFSHERAQQIGSTNSTRILPVTYTRGLSETLDISVGVNHTRISSNDPGTDVSSGSGNPSLGLKWRFHDDEASKTSLAFKLDLGLPIEPEKEAAGLGSGRASYGLTAILAQETSFGAVLANLATGQTRYRDTASNPDTTTLRASIAPVWQVTDQWKLALDLGSETEWATGNKTHAEFIEIGIIYSPDKDLDFALGFVRCNDHGNPGSTSNGVTGGVTWRFR